MGRSADGSVMAQKTAPSKADGGAPLEADKGGGGARGAVSGWRTVLRRLKRTARLIAVCADSAVIFDICCGLAVGL